MKVEIDISGMVLLDDKEYMVTSCETVVQAYRKIASEQVTLILSGADGDVELVFFAALKKGSIGV